MSEQTLRTDVHISDDRGTVSITFRGSSGSRSATVRLNLDDLSVLITALGSARQTMVAGRPMPSLQGQRVQTVLKPQWYIQPEPLSEGSVISFYHPGFGPVAFLVPREHVEAMVRLLTAHLGIAHSSGSKPN
jgi:hypothetical protein